MKAVVLGFTGSIKSGKSTVSTRVAGRLQWPRVSFGDFIRKEAHLRGMNTERETLQDLGESLIQEKGWETFCNEVLKEANWSPGESLVIDGIRHIQAVEILRNLVLPSKFLLILIKASDHQRRIRAISDSMSEGHDLERFSSHSTEIQVKTVLPDLADLTINGDISVDKLTDEVIAWAMKQSQHYI